MSPRWGVLMATIMTSFCAASRAHAYRPFDSTDASVENTGVLELELGPVGYYRAGKRDFLVAPSLILNCGFAPRWEVVLQGRHFILLDDVAAAPRAQLVETGVFAKGVLRNGTLQGESGPSVATELGVLLPTVHAEPGMGLTGALIVSQRWAAATLHVNGAVSRTRSGNADFFGALIAEGPHAWVVRPVVEIYCEHEVSVDTVLSGLLGAIWRAGDSLALDAALRAGGVAGTRVYEARVGLTWAVTIVRSP